MKLAVLVSLVLISAVNSSKFSISRFSGPPLSVEPPSGMYELGGLGFENVTNGNQVLAYGDFNNDKFTDIVSMADDHRTLTVFIYSPESYSFWPFVSFSTHTGKIVLSVIPGDFNFDGYLDLLVLTTDSSSKVQTFLEYYFRSQEDPFFGELLSLGAGQPHLSYTLEGQAQPFLLEAQGDRKTDVMFVENGIRKIQTVIDGELQQHEFTEFVSNDPACKSYSLVYNNPFAVPHSNSFVDFNGDCAADIFITSIDPTTSKLVFEIWLRNTDSKFCLVDVTPIEYPSISPVSIGDMNNDGRIDLVFASIPVEPTEPMNLHTIYNIAPKDPSTPGTAVQAAMVSTFSPLGYNALESTPGVNQVIPIVGQMSVSSRLFSPDPINRPSKIRIGDINSDGYPDLLLVVRDPVTSKTTLSGSVVIAINQESVPSFNEGVTSTDDSGYFLLLDDQPLTSSGDVALSSVGAWYASFFDFSESGRLGLWIVLSDEAAPASSLIGAYNFVTTRNFILKTLVLNGVKPPEVDNITDSLGGFYYGASLEFKITDVNGQASLSKAAQLSQSAYTPLDLPYMLIGLGKTSNYIENLAIGIAAKVDETVLLSDKQQTTWTPIIPNSQLIINPLISEEWTLDVYVNPASETTAVALITLLILMILGALILNLYHKEKIEDQKEIVYMLR